MNTNKQHVYIEEDANLYLKGSRLPIIGRFLSEYFYASLLYMTFGKKDIKDRVNKMYGSYGIMIMITPLYSKRIRSNIPR